MRVITGVARGMKLKELPGMSTRPTTDMVKEAMFSILQFELEGRRVLDLFAGTGQLGIEALSRGARSAVFVDESLQAIEVIRENLKKTGLADAAEVYRADSVSFSKSCGKFDIVLLDPPYDSGLMLSVLKNVEKFDILNDGGIIICETKADKSLPELSAPYVRGREYRYGTVKLTVYRRQGDQASE